MITLALLIASLHVVDVDAACLPHVSEAPAPIAAASSRAPPVVAVKDGKVSFSLLDGARVGDVLEAIARNAGVNIVGNGAGLQAPFVGWLRDAPVADAIEAVAHSGGLEVSVPTEPKSGRKRERPFIVLPRDDMRAFVLVRARERDERSTVKTRTMKVPSQNGDAWVEPIVKAVLSCRGGAAYTATTSALFVMDLRPQVEFVERAMEKRVAGVERMESPRRERIARTPTCPTGSADATNATALALARKVLSKPNATHRAGHLIGCPAPIALAAGDLADLDNGSALLDVSWVPPSRDVAWPAPTGAADVDAAAVLRYDADLAKQIHVSTRTAVAEALSDRQSPDMVWAVKLADAASASAFAALLQLEYGRAVIVPAPNDVVFVRGALEMDKHIVDLAARVPDMLRDPPATKAKAGSARP